MGIGTAANTHAMYGTVSHTHLDCLVNWAIGEFPDAGLNLVGCGDGQWFVEVDHGGAFDHLDGISKPNVSPFTEPRFFTSEGEALGFAIECIKVVYPKLASRTDLASYFDEE